MSIEGLSALLAAGLAAGAPIALAALGGLFTAAAGSLSVSLEGSMIVGAFFAAAASEAGGGVYVGFAAAALAGLSLALLVGYVSTKLGADVFVAGLAANLLAPGFVSILSASIFGTKGVVSATSLGLAELQIPFFGELPFIGRALFGQDPAFYALVMASLILSLVFLATPFGLRLRAAGDPGEAAAAAGIDRGRARLAAHLVAGAAAGLAGAALSAKVAAFVPGMSSGRGWIALVALYLGGSRPLGAALASLGFGLLIALSNAAQAIQGAPAELFLAAPYLITALALVFGKALGKSAVRKASSVAHRGGGA